MIRGNRTLGPTVLTVVGENEILTGSTATKKPKQGPILVDYRFTLTNGAEMKSTALLRFLCFGAALTMAGSVSAEIKVGDDVPDFKMVGSDGETYSNKDFKGKKAFVIAWYPKAFTGG
jgi:hypothetical protein